MTSAFSHLYCWLLVTWRKKIIAWTTEGQHILSDYLSLSILLGTFNIVFFPHSNSIKLTFNIPHFQMRKLRHRENIHSRSLSREMRVVGFELEQSDSGIYAVDYYAVCATKRA